jgi:hypothetical protein
VWRTERHTTFEDCAGAEVGMLAQAPTNGPGCTDAPEAPLKVARMTEVARFKSRFCMMNRG